MVGAILGLLSSIIGSISANSANNKSQSELDALAGKQKVPDSVRAGEQIMREQASGNMPGYDNQMSNIDSSQAQTINQAKDYVSGGGLLSALSNIYTKGNEQKRGVMDANSMFQTQAKDKLASYLGQVSGGAEQTVQNDLNSLALAKVGINQAGTQDTLNFMNTGLNAVGNDKGLLAIINQLLSGSGSNSTTGNTGIFGGAAPPTGSYINVA